MIRRTLFIRHLMSRAYLNARLRSVCILVFRIVGARTVRMSATAVSAADAPVAAPVLIALGIAIRRIPFAAFVPIRIFVFIILFARPRAEAHRLVVVFPPEEIERMIDLIRYPRRFSSREPRCDLRRARRQVLDFDIRRARPFGRQPGRPGRCGERNTLLPCIEVVDARSLSLRVREIDKIGRCGSACRVRQPAECEIFRVKVKGETRIAAQIDPHVAAFHNRNKQRVRRRRQFSSCRTRPSRRIVRRRFT